MPSFDIVSKTNLAEIDNAINGALKEISNRYDFKESKSEIKRENDLIEMISDDNYKIDQVQQILRTYCVRRKVDTGFLEFQKIEDAGTVASNNADVPSRYLPCLTYALAFNLATKIPEAQNRIGIIKQRYDELWNDVSDADREKAPVKFVPDMNVYR